MGNKRFDITNTRLPAKAPAAKPMQQENASVKSAPPPSYSRTEKLREAITATKRREAEAGL